MFDYDRDRDRFKEIVGGDIEFAYVEFNGRRTCMIVNDTGSIQQPPLPINYGATKIYHTYPARRDGLSMDEAWFRYPHIHGDVALLDGIEVP